MTNIKIKKLVKKYGKKFAVNKIDLDIKDGELFILLGPSGCGKSTTLLSIAGVIKPEEGEIWFDDIPIFNGEKKYNERPQDRNIAMVFQDYAIYPHMTVFKNIAFPLEVRKKSKKEIEKLVYETAKSLDIEDQLEKKPRQLSGGQRQRVALARAIVREPNVFLMDEPLSNLDAKLRVFARASLKKLHKRLGITIVYVTHDQIEAMSMGDTIAILNKGIIEQVDKPLNIYNSPKNLFVAGFIGSPPMNMIEGSLKEANGSLYIDVGVINYQLPEKYNKFRDMKQKEVVLGIRPENIDILNKKVDNSIKGKIDIIEPLGREFEIHIDIGVKILITMVKDIEDLKIGNEVYVSFDDNKLHLFNKETEENLCTVNHKKE